MSKPQRPEQTAKASIELSAPALRLLGGLTISSPNPSIGIINEPRFHVRALLALAGSGRTGVARDEMVELLWPESEVTAARNRLYHTVHLARQTLGAASWEDKWIVVHQARIILDKRISCDVLKLEKAGEVGFAEMSDTEIQNMLPLSKLEWMPDLDIGTAGEAVRSRVRNLQASLMREAIMRSMRRGGTAHSEILGQLLRMEPTEEQAHQNLMKLNLNLGRNHTVIRIYNELTNNLSANLGLKPQTETSNLAAMAADRLNSPFHAVTNRKYPNNLALTLVVGQEKTLSSMLEDVTQKSGFWNIHGMAGVGKTLVVQELVRRLADRQPVCTLWINFVTGMKVDDLSQMVVNHPLFKNNESVDQPENLSTIVNIPSTVIIIDDIPADFNFELLLREWKSDKFLAKILTVSQKRCRLPEVKKIHIRGLQSNYNEKSERENVQASSMDLFLMFNPNVCTNAKSENSQLQVSSLLTFLGGLPLAIRVAAASSIHFSPLEIQADLTKFLTSGRSKTGVPFTKYDTLKSALDRGLQELTPSDRTVYWALSFFEESFSYSKACWLLSHIALKESAVINTISELIDLSYLDVSVDDASPSLYMPLMLRSHARGWATLASTDDVKVITSAYGQIARCK